MKQANQARLRSVPAALRPRLRKRGDLMVEEIKRWMVERQANVGDKLPKEVELLFISEGTLKWHLHNLYRKLGCKNRTGALAAARRGGILEGAPQT